MNKKTIQYSQVMPQCALVDADHQLAGNFSRRCIIDAVGIRKGAVQIASEKLEGTAVMRA